MKKPSATTLVVSAMIGLTEIAVLSSLEKRVERLEDITADGVQDRVVEDRVFQFVRDRQFYIGTKDGLFVKADLRKTEDGLQYLFIDPNTRYIFDGKNYVRHQMRAEQ